MKLKNKKILFVAEYFPPHIMGGAEISAEVKVGQLSKENDIIVLTPNYDNKKLVIKKIDNYKIIRFPTFRHMLYKNRKKTSQKVRVKNKSLFNNMLLSFYIISAFEFKRWIYKINKKYGPFDIIYGNNIESDLGISFSNLKIKKMGCLRDSIIFDNSPKNNIIIKFIKKKFKKDIDIFVAITKFIQNKYVKILNIPQDRFIIERMNNKVPDYMISTLTKKSARKKLNLSLNKKYALFVGSLTKEKGINYLVKNIAPNFPNITFLILGDGYLFDNLKNIKSNNIILKGNIEKKLIKNYYKAADIVLVTSIWEEPMGRIPLEAQANGTYVLVTDKGGLPETIQSGKGKSLKLELFSKEIKKYFKRLEKDGIK